MLWLGTRCRDPGRVTSALRPRQPRARRLSHTINTPPHLTSAAQPRSRLDQRSPAMFACAARRAGFSSHDVGDVCASSTCLGQRQFLALRHAGLSDASLVLCRPPSITRLIDRIDRIARIARIAIAADSRRTRQNPSEALGARIRPLPRQETAALVINCLRLKAMPREDSRSLFSLLFGGSSSLL
jgi:hypothetical protein